MWWPPEKIAAQYLAPYLAEQPDLAAIPVLAVRGPAPPTRRNTASSSAGSRWRFAYADANIDQHAAALRWLRVLETIDGALQPEHAELRDRWQAAQRGPKAAPDRADKIQS